MGLGKDLEQCGRAYGDLRLAIGWTVGLIGENAKVSRHWQSRPDKLANADHGAGIFARGVFRNPVVSLRASNLVGIDVDGEPGRRLLRQLVPDGFPATVAVRSGREDGGLHGWFRPPPGCRHHKIEFSHRLELSADGYLLVPPSIHPSGKRYEFVDGRAPWEHEIAELPAAV